MTIVDALYGLEPSGLLMILVAIRLLYDCIHVWLIRAMNGEKPRCPAELHLLLGIGFWGLALGWILLMAMVRRDLTAGGGDVSWYLDSWPYVAVKLIAVIGTIEIVAGVSLEDYGHKPWIITAAATILFMVWSEPGRWLSWATFELYRAVR